ncbi:ATP-dependent DNA helicase [Trichonephila clavipes]|nr:ATP-dependent DNA helicase [Trichonephila clavipes]
MSERVPIEESLSSQQQTLKWNEEKYLYETLQEKKRLPHCWLFDEHAEELPFPSIYLAQFRKFRERVNVTPYVNATTEIRRSDRVLLRNIM